MAKPCCPKRVIVAGGVAPPVADAWLEGLNAGTAPISGGGTNALGTSDNKNLDIATNGVRRVTVSATDGGVRFYPDGTTEQTVIAANEFSGTYPVVDPTDSAPVTVGFESSVTAADGRPGSVATVSTATVAAISGVRRLISGAMQAFRRARHTNGLTVLQTDTVNAAGSTADWAIKIDGAPGGGSVDVNAGVVSGASATNTTLVVAPGAPGQTEIVSTATVTGASHVAETSWAGSGSTVLDLQSDAVGSSAKLEATDGTDTRNIEFEPDRVLLQIGDLVANTIPTLAPGQAMAVMVVGGSGGNELRAAPLDQNPATLNFEAVI